MRKLSTKIAAFALAGLTAFAFAAGGCEETPGPGPGPDPGTELFQNQLTVSEDYQTGVLRTASTDDYGRSFTASGDYASDKYVGIFYCLWQSYAPTSDVPDVSVFEESGKAENVLTGSDVPSQPNFTWWGKPMYDYYVAGDKWVIRRHLELFINAGLDFICFDCSNDNIYTKAANAFLEVAKELQDLGYDVPKLMFMTNTDTVARTEEIYRNYYRDGTYDSLWFRGNGEKPWILSHANQLGGLDSEISSYFYFKRAQWPNAATNTNNFPWMSWSYPQETYQDSQVGKIMSVSVAEHVGISGNQAVRADFSDSGLCAPYNFDTLSETAISVLTNLGAKRNMSAKEYANLVYNANWGRGFSHEDNVNDPDRVNENINFEEQWATALDESRDITLVFVTGWNEWTAQKQSDSAIFGGEYGHYVDLFNREFSRDAEMMEGGYLDNCYLQLVRNIRLFKETEKAAVFARSAGFDPYDLAQWSAITAVYKDLTTDTEPRNAMSAAMEKLTNDTGRNDISEVRVASDDENVYFLIQTVADITEKEADDAHWMNLYIGVDGKEGGWNGLHYVVNRSLSGTEASLSRIEDGSYTDVAKAKTEVSGNLMLVTVKKSDLGITGACSLQFKVCDNLQKDFDITDLYVNGDCAPLGRINYVYSAE